MCESSSSFALPRGRDVGLKWSCDLVARQQRSSSYGWQNWTQTGLKFMASLWEVSAVIAMRDLQWIFAPDGGLPDAGINLAGNAESRLGDLAAHINDRFFLFEIKPQASNFSSEWKMKKRGGEEKRTKHAYASVLKLVKKWHSNYNCQAALDDVIRSLRCHHFAYWHVGAPTDIHNRLCLQPYLRAVIEGSIASHGLNDVVTKVADEMSLGYSRKVDPQSAFPFGKCKFASLGAAHHGHLGIAVFQPSSNFYLWLPLGLEMKDFSAYIGSLVANAPSKKEPLNSVAISTGGWQRVLGTTDDLADLLKDLSNAPSPNPNGSEMEMRTQGPGESFADTDDSANTFNASLSLKDYVPRTSAPGRRNF